jgi:hypothetical protein
MTLTTAQQTALKANILADGTLAPLVGTADGRQAIADAYNALAAPDYFVWSTSVAVNDIFDNVTWANFTPQATPDTTVQWTNWSLACQGKQFNLQTILSGRTTLDASKTNIRAGLNDATTNLPSGAAGASRSGGWTAILPILSRKAKRIEKLFAIDDGAGIGNTITDPRGASTNPDKMVYEGTISATDVQNALNQG